MSNSTEPAPPPPPASTSGPTRGAIATVVVAMALLAALVWGLTPRRVNLKPAPLDPLPQGCPKVVREFVPSNVTEIPALPLADLTPAQRQRALYRMNFEPCNCGCNASIAYCRVNNPQCEISRKAAEKIIAEVRGGGDVKK